MKKSAKRKRGGKRAGAGRPPLTPEGRHQLNLRITPEQHARWTKAADTLPLSQWVRDVLDRAARKP
jgi:hypothetical protein